MYSWWHRIHNSEKTKANYTITMKKPLLLILALFLLALPLVIADDDLFPYYYVSDDAFSKTGNETFGDSNFNNWSVSGCAVVGGVLTCDGANDKANYVHELIDVDTNPINYTMFEADIALLSTSEGGCFVLIANHDNDSVGVEDQGFNIRKEVGGSGCARIVDGEANGWISSKWCFDGTVNHIKLVIKQGTQAGRATGLLYVNGTLDGAITDISRTAGVYSKPKYMLWGTDWHANKAHFTIDNLVSYNGSVYNLTGELPITIINNTKPNLTINYPTNGSTIGNTTDYPLLIYGNVTVQNGSIYNTTINSTDWYNKGNQTHFNFTFNGTMREGLWIVNISSNSTHGNRTDIILTFRIDLTAPLLVSELSKNNTLIYAYENLTFNVTATDDEKVYYFNISTPEGYFLEINNTNTTKYIFNGSINVSDYGVGRHNITVETCDAHTSKQIPEFDNIIGKDNDITFYFNNRHISIEPLDKTAISKAFTKKEKDRYTFTYTKNALNLQENIGFIVSSTDYIDIIGNEGKYKGWLVIPKLQKWIDFNTDEMEKLNYRITRIKDNSVKVEIEGIKGNTFTFNSIGSLNCIKQEYLYYIYNYTVNYDSRATSNFPTTIDLIIDYKDIVLNSSAIIVYNQTGYTIANTSSENQFNYTVNITPLRYTTITHDINLSFNYTLNNTQFFTLNYTQIIDSIFLSYFGNLSNTSAINFTFWDELNNSQIENANVKGTFNYLTNSKFEPSLSNTNNLTIAIYPTGANTTGDYVVYYSGDGYPERRYSVTSAIYNNKTQVIKLYMLESTNYATFLVTDIYGNPIEDVTGEMEKSIGGSTVTVEQQVSDGSGLMSFLVDVDDDYTFTFSKIGYVSHSETLRPITTEIYTVVLEEEADETYSFASGILYHFEPTISTLNNNTKYNFTFNLTSSYWEITDCSLTLKNTSEDLAVSDASYDTDSCSIRIELSTGNQTTIISEATYELNGTATETVTQQYTIKYTYKGEFSFKNFIDDIISFSGSGFNDFTRMIIAFIIIFSITALLSVEYPAFRDAETLIIFVWVLVLFFSYTGFLTLNYDKIPDIAIVGKEWLQQYIIFILFSLGAGSYLIRRHL